MRLTLTSALLAFSLISYVSAHPLAVEPDSRVSELAERDVDHFQWLERRVTPEEEAARRLRNDRAYKARKAEKLRALDERARQGDEQAKAEFDAITEARRASNRAAAKKFRDKKKAEKAQDSASASGGSGSQGASSGYRPSQGGSSGYHQAGSSGVEVKEAHMEANTRVDKVQVVRTLRMEQMERDGSRAARFGARLELELVKIWGDNLRKRKGLLLKAADKFSTLQL
ncbi:hypothetical protein K474DRAFT_1681037, partial [Panus rudis PR-1116 ss-1]